MFKNVLVIGCEGLSKVIDWGHRSTCVLFGDGAGAAILTASEDPSIIKFDLGAIGKLGMAITIPGTHFTEADLEARNNEHAHTIRMDGREVFKFATKTMAKSVKKLLNHNKLTMDDIDLIIPHQANIRIMQTAAKRLGISMDKIYSVIHKYGNTSSASIPIALHDAVEEGRVKAGDRIVLTGFGGGLTWASVLIEWV
jgi:3-oxoacyl-[acyl-carrier-protein] synthase-3